MSRKHLAWAVIPICLFLISMGIRVPNLTSLHPPKPRPRAVIETTSKTSQDASTKSVIAVELCDNLPALLPPELFKSRFSRETCQFSSTTPPQTDARAPPCFSC
jgi:hypothetical protein